MREFILLIIAGLVLFVAVLVCFVVAFWVGELLTPSPTEK